MLAPKKVQEQYTSVKTTKLLPVISATDSAKDPERKGPSIPINQHHRDHPEPHSDDDLPARTTHDEAFGTLDPTDFWDPHVPVHPHAQGDSSRFSERLFRVLRGNRGTDNDSSSAPQSRVFQPPWITGKKDKQESDRIIDELNAAFRDIGLLHPHKPPKLVSKRKSDLDQIPDDCLCMVLPLWPGETGSVSADAEISNAASFFKIPENRQYLFVYYVPLGEAKTKDKRHEKKKAKQTHSSGGDVETDGKSVYIPSFRVVARVAAYYELQQSNVRLPVDGLAVNDPQGKAMGYPTSTPSENVKTTHTVVCQCYGRESGFDFLEHGLLELGLCTQEEDPVEPEDDEQGGRVTVLTPIGRAAVEMIWLGCLAITSFGPT